MEAPGFEPSTFESYVRRYWLCSALTDSATRARHVPFVSDSFKVTNENVKSIKKSFEVLWKWKMGISVQNIFDTFNILKWASEFIEC